MSNDFAKVFERLTGILRKQTGALQVTEDTERKFCMEGGIHPRSRTPMPVAWVEIGKGYVSYHLMPVYGCPKLVEGMSERLRGRMQGKSCFNFKTVDEELFTELERVTREGIAMFARGGWLEKSRAT